MTKQHNGEIALWKFIYCLMIIALHIGASLNFKYGIFFNGGSIGVAFFFIVSGYLMSESALSKKEVRNEEIGDETATFLKKRAFKLIPYILFAYVACLLYQIIMNRLPIYKIVNSIFEPLFISQAGFRNSSVNYVTWYISVMFIDMLIIYPIMLKHKRNYYKIIAPLLVILVGGYLSFQYGHVAKGPYYKMILIGLFELALGTVINYAVRAHEKKEWTNTKKIFMALISWVGFISILFITNKAKSHENYDFIMIIILSISIGISFTGKTPLSKILNNKAIFYLEKLSLPLYLNQVWIIDIVMKLLNGKDNFQYLELFGIIIGIDIVVSSVLMYVINRITKKRMCRSEK